MPSPIAIATCRAWPTLCDDDRALLAALAEAGVAAEIAIWNDDVDWSRYSGVLLRSVWDYFEHAAAFSAWLDTLDRLGLPCWNSTSLVRWNMDKRYLRELASRGVATVPTLWFERAAGRESSGTSSAEVARRVAEAGWADVVLKPTVSGGAWRTLRLRGDEIALRAAEIDVILASSGLMVQPFVPEIVDEGEYSLLFFGGEFSHAALKRAKPGDFRVQWTHGGTQVASTPSPGIISQARAVIEAAPEPGLYARVDGIVRDGRLILMELEQLEPYLFFEQSPGSAKRFVEAFLRTSHGAATGLRRTVLPLHGSPARRSVARRSASDQSERGP